MGVIELSKGTYRYKDIPLYLGKKKMDLQISKENLADFQKIMMQYQIPFSLAYGTLLGAIRENNFIKHDEDIDINMLDSDRNKFLELLFELRKQGFEVARYDERGFMSILRNNEYIDICFYAKMTDDIYECCGNFLLSKWVTDLVPYDFLGSTYNIPKDYISFFLFYYGDNWKIPYEYKHSMLKQYISQLVLFIKNLMPDKIKYYLLDKKSEKQKQEFIAKLKTFKH